jgi:hypothetical protein
MPPLMTATKFKSYVPAAASIDNAVLTDFITQEIAYITEQLGDVDLTAGEEAVISETFFNVNGAFIVITAHPNNDTLLSCTQGPNPVAVPSTEYLVYKDTITRRPLGFYYPNYFDTVGYGLQQYWIPPVTVTYHPDPAFVNSIRRVLTELVTLSLSVNGTISGQIAGQLEFYKIGEQAVKFSTSMTVGSQGAETARQNIIGRILKRKQRVG